jgi:hypothetical protein
LTRFRTTALPTFRETTNPRRGPGLSAPSAGRLASTKMKCLVCSRDLDS